MKRRRIICCDLVTDIKTEVFLNKIMKINIDNDEMYKKKYNSVTFQNYKLEISIEIEKKLVLKIIYKNKQIKTNS